LSIIAVVLLGTDFINLPQNHSMKNALAVFFCAAERRGNPAAYLCGDHICTLKFPAALCILNKNAAPCHVLSQALFYAAFVYIGARFFWNVF
jgi:hypothetical protein